MDYFYLIAGLFILIASGEILVKGAVNLAYKFQISTLVVGMTIISFGTSAPELLVSLKSTLEGHPDIAIGNVIGSNIANLGLVLGITAMIFPIKVDRNSIRVDWPMMMLATIVLYLFMLNYKIEFWEGAILLLALIVFIVTMIRTSRKQNKTAALEKSSEEKPDNHVGNKNVKQIAKDTIMIVLGAVGLMFGADWLVDGAVNVARGFGVSDLVISVTVVALGTSAPELVTSGVAAFRQHSDISVGNLIGSNIFNIMAILGITPLIKEIDVNAQVVSNDMFWVLGISAAVLPMLMINKNISRLEGGLLFATYLVYVYFLLN
mgnify:FL=1